MNSYINHFVCHLKINFMNNCLQILKTYHRIV